MKNNAEWKRVARLKDGEGEPAMDVASALPRALRIMAGKGGISINALKTAAEAIVTDIETLGKQLGSDAPEMKSDDQPSDSSAPEEGQPSEEPAGDLSENLRKQIRRRLRQLKTTS